MALAYNLRMSETKTSSPDSAPVPINWFACYQPWQRIAEPGFWIALYCLQSWLNSQTVIMDFARGNINIAPWEPITWEWSSNMVLLALVPLVVLMHRRFALRLGHVIAHLPWHLAASVIYCALHVAGMVAIRHAVYAMHGATYDFGDWPRELLYEYSKDVRTYGVVGLILTAYELILTRLQGEARLLAAPDIGKPEGTIERPERFLVKKLGKEFLLPANEVEYLQAMGNYVNLHVRGKDYPLRSTMSEIETRFNPAKFVRVHRSYIVNLEMVVDITALDSGDARATLKSGSTVPVSRRYREALRAAAISES